LAWIPVEHNYMAWDSAMDVTQQQAIENIDYIEWNQFS
jgi:hypothetical protein